MSTTTTLTPNSQVVVTMTATTAQASFQIMPTDISYWSPSVATSFVTATNATDTGNGVVIFNKGLTLQMLPQGNGSYTVIVTGNITDNGTVYPIAGMAVGTYTAS
ncbi:hypothetical protein H4S14_000093 [Agrobacterium vitis]|nr:hypothetical protein [Agrobacterium vitis]MBE1436366.1 hypothetical protein [Agrobacterium vitis]